MKSTLPLSNNESIEGLSIAWHQWTPTSPTRGAFFFLHGQGDFSERYQLVADVFLKQGIAFLCCDLPGHGRSEGKRGHIPSLDLVSRLVEIGISKARALSPKQPLGFGGHSVGGLLALHFLRNSSVQPDFSWISSPLLDVEEGQPSWKPKVLVPLSFLLPAMTISTGVQADDLLRRPTEGHEIDETLFHNRISLSWGRQLLNLSKEVRTQPKKQPVSLPFLLTQGEEDPVCPLTICQEFAGKIENKKMELKTFPNSLHEPFSDENQEQFLQLLENWLERSVK